MEYKGIGIVSGITKATLWLAKPDFFSLAQESITLVEEELQVVRIAFNNVFNKYKIISKKAVTKAGKAAGMIVEGHCLMVSDMEYQKKICSMISLNKVNAEFAIQEITNEYVEMLNQNGTAYFRARRADFIDSARAVINEIKKIKNKEQNLNQIERGDAVIAMGESFSVEDLILLTERDILGVIDFSGEEEGHVSVIAKSLELPMIIQMDATLKRLEGKKIQMDGSKGIVSIE